MNGYTFERRELKYRITDAQRAALEAAFDARMVPDEYGESTICNIYYDTADYRLIRAPLEKPAYKEKLRLRSYGVTGPGGEVFLELKKKYKGIVYKRRITLPEDAAGEFIAGRARSVNTPLKAVNSRSGFPLRTVHLLIPLFLLKTICLLKTACGKVPGYLPPVFLKVPVQACRPGTTLHLPTHRFLPPADYSLLLSHRPKGHAHM